MQKKNYNTIFRIGVGIVFCLLFLLPKNVLAQEITNQLIYQLVNQERTEQNLQPLTINYQLEKAAWQRANDMISKNYFSHQSPEGLMPWDFALQQNYDYQFLGENLALGWSTAEETLEAWMQSSTHRYNILNNHFNETGIAVAINKNNYLIVQLFGQRANFISEAENQTENQLAINNQIPATSVDTETPITSVSPIISDSSLTENNSVLGMVSEVETTTRTIPPLVNPNYLLFCLVVNYFLFLIYLHLQTPLLNKESRVIHSPKK